MSISVGDLNAFVSNPVGNGYRRETHIDQQTDVTVSQIVDWRYTFPAEDTTRIWAKAPSQELSNMLVEAFKKDLK